MANGQVTTGLAGLPPGPELAAALATIDPAQASNGEIITVLRAWSRLRAQVDARFLAVVAEVGRRDPDSELHEVARLSAPARYGADETRLALAWTRRAAEAEHDFAEVLTIQLPAVWTALDHGEIDRPKARAFYDHLSDLPAAHIELICRALLPKAGGLTTGQLRARLARMVIAIDPRYARKQYEKAVAERGVVGCLNPDGTAVITADRLPPDEAAAACERIDRLARAAKRAGHPGRLDQIRADVFLGLLDGRFDKLNREQIVSLLVDTAASVPPVRTGIEVRVELGTLLGHDDHPGEIPGWGPVTADVARRVVGRQRGAEWRFAVTDADGHLVCAGITRRRPVGVRKESDGGVVELHVPATLLHELAGDPPAAWAGVITDIAKQLADWPEREPTLDGRPGRRLPTEPLRRDTQVRDRTCRGPGCRRPATRSEFDHTRDYRHGGATVRSNGGHVCDHDHDLKTKGGWILRQPQPGTFIWISPLGQVHRTRGDPVILPLPEPENGDDDPPPF
ncbi:HNH endonuclease signature motif containing protein [Pseudonocardia acaciae]|uniref:HNH endonuclease signature motif containing protein n=1 Tax=Pseudonocardia acaciae TaxID=551276 RepID=UPI00049190E3|nr:HNH endonuclease signature motif containing protein [Pseudonocardia acaciae]